MTRADHGQNFRGLGWRGFVFLVGGVGFVWGCQGEPSAGAHPEQPEFCDAPLSGSTEARLLTRVEYRNTVADLLGTTLDPTGSFPAEPMVESFFNHRTSHQANPLLVEHYQKAAAELAHQALDEGISRLHPCPEETLGENCADLFIQGFGKRAFRRPLTDQERRSFLTLYQRAAPTLGQEEALSTIVEVMLQAPQFLYRVEAPPQASDEQALHLGPYEMASRLSYFLQGTMPDPELLRAAGEGQLGTRAEVALQARRLLASPAARWQIRDFYRQWLGLSQLDSIERQSASFPQHLQESLLRFVDGLHEDANSNIAHLYSSPDLFLNAELATTYGLPAPEGDWQKYSLPGQRSGLLTQPAVLTLLSHADQSSPIFRGVFVRQNFLCAPVEPPPPSVNNTPPDPQPGLTTRELFRVHTEAAVCATCHSLIDPIGFGLEHYDELGRYRETQSGLAVDASGELVGLPEESLNGPFDGAIELAEKIATSETALSCLAQKWATFALGRSLEPGDQCSLDRAVAQASASGGNLSELLVALVSSDAFRFRPAHESDGAGNKQESP